MAGPSRVRSARSCTLEALERRLEELRKVANEADISFVQRSALMESDSLMEQARYMLRLSQK